MTVYAIGNVTPELHETVWVAPNAQLMGNVHMAEHASVWFGAVLRGDNERIQIGRNSNIQDNSILHTDIGFPMTIGDNVTVGHRVMLHGCAIGDNSLIGIGATILNGAKIGKNCVIGAHALVTEGKDIPDNSLVMGAPGKVVKNVSEAQINLLRMSAEVYVKNAQRFAAELKAL